MYMYTCLFVQAEVLRRGNFGIYVDTRIQTHSHAEK